MTKVFEDYFSDLQADMVSICLEYVYNKADNIYIYCSCENKTITCAYFYRINGRIVSRSKLNDAIKKDQKPYDISIARQKTVIRIINEDIQKIMEICMQFERPMPTELKLIYDVKNNRLNANYRYDLIYTNDPVKTADDIAEEWFEEIKSQS